MIELGLEPQVAVGDDTHYPSGLTKMWKSPCCRGKPDEYVCCMANNTVRHSMLNIRLGALPDTEVKIPQFPPGKLEQPLRPKSVR